MHWGRRGRRRPGGGRDVTTGPRKDSPPARGSRPGVRALRRTKWSQRQRQAAWTRPTGGCWSGGALAARRSGRDRRLLATQSDRDRRLLPEVRGRSRRDAASCAYRCRRRRVSVWSSSPPAPLPLFRRGRGRRGAGRSEGPGRLVKRVETAGRESPSPSLFRCHYAGACRSGGIGGNGREVTGGCFCRSRRESGVSSQVRALPASLRRRLPAGELTPSTERPRGAVVEVVGARPTLPGTPTLPRHGASATAEGSDDPGVDRPSR